MSENRDRRSLIYNAIRTPDGTVLESRYRWDYKQHKDKNGYSYVVDGGLDYTRYSHNTAAPPENLCVYLEDGHEKVRQFCFWGTRGKRGDQPLKYIRLCDMETNHIEACLDTQNMHPNYVQAFKDELEYRHSQQ